MKKFTSVILLSICILFSNAQTKTLMVYFPFNDYEIPDTAMLSMVQLIHRYAIQQVNIEAHCDSIGTTTYNQTLSQKRAAAIVKLLTENGVQKSAIKTVIGYGKTKPLNDNETEERRLLNRRAKVDFYFVEKHTEPTMQPKATIPMDTLHFKVGNTIELQNLLFIGGTARFQPESYSVLNELATIMKKKPNLQIHIEGHVCCTSIESDGINIDTGGAHLSEDRAIAVYDFLLEQHISPKRLSYEGFGGSKKKFPYEKSEEEKKQNRRVEIKILRE